jgi:hypothetical protein
MLEIHSGNSSPEDSESEFEIDRILAAEYSAEEPLEKPPEYPVGEPPEPIPELPPAPPPPEPPDGLGLPRSSGSGRDARTPIELVLEFPPYGEIRYNAKFCHMVAHCNVAGHGKTCKKQRTTTAAKNHDLSVDGQGRPLGLLSAWLKDGRNHVSQFEHSRFSAPALILASRKEARRECMLLPRAVELASKERKQETENGEASEPEIMNER